MQQQAWSKLTKTHINQKFSCPLFCFTLQIEGDNCFTNNLHFDFPSLKGFGDGKMNLPQFSFLIYQNFSYKTWKSNCYLLLLQMCVQQSGGQQPAALLLLILYLICFLIFHNIFCCKRLIQISPDPSSREEES